MGLGVCIGEQRKRTRLSGVMARGTVLKQDWSDIAVEGNLWRGRLGAGASRTGAIVLSKGGRADGTHTQQASNYGSAGRGHSVSAM